MLQEIPSEETISSRRRTARAERCHALSAASLPIIFLSSVSGVSISCCIIAVLATLLPMTGSRRSMMSIVCPGLCSAWDTSAPLMPAPTTIVS